MGGCALVSVPPVEGRDVLILTLGPLPQTAPPPQAHEACGPLEIDSALKTVHTLRSELQDAKMSVIDGQLRPLPGESVSTTPAPTPDRPLALRTASCSRSGVTRQGAQTLLLDHPVQ